MIILVRFGSMYAEKAKEILSTLTIYRDGPGFRPVVRQTYYFPLNDIRTYADGEVKLIWEVGLGGKEDFYSNVIDPLEQQDIPLVVEEFITETDKKSESLRRERELQNVYRKGVSVINGFADRIKPDSKNWYAVGYKEDYSDGWGKENDLIFQKAQELSIEIGWFQAQGSRFIWVHCEHDELLKLLNSLGVDEYYSNKLDSMSVKLIKSNRHNYPVPPVND